MLNDLRVWNKWISTRRVGLEFNNCFRSLGGMLTLVNVNGPNYTRTYIKSGNTLIISDYVEELVHETTHLVLWKLFKPDFDPCESLDKVFDWLEERLSDPEWYVKKRYDKPRKRKSRKSSH